MQHTGVHAGSELVTFSRSHIHTECGPFNLAAHTQPIVAAIQCAQSRTFTGAFELANERAYLTTLSSAVGCPIVGSVGTADLELA